MDKLSFFREKQYANELASVYNAKELSKLIELGYNTLKEARAIKENNAWVFFEMSKQDIENDIISIERNLTQLTMALGFVEKFQVYMQKEKPIILHLN